MITVFAMCLFLAQPTVDEVRAAAETLFADKTAGDVVWNKGEVQVSPLGFHVRYQRQYQGVPIVDRQPRKVHFDSHLSKVYAHADAPAVAKFPGFGRLSTEAVQDALSKLNAEPGAEQPPKKAFKKKPEVDPEKDWRVTGTSRFYLVTRQAVLAIVRLEVSSADDQEQYWLDLDSGTGQVVNRFNRTLNHQAPAAIQQKTEGRGTIWRHNPVAAAATPGDPSSKQVSVPLRGLDGSGYLRGAYVDVTVPSPVVPAQYQSRHWLHYKPGQALEPSFTYDYDPSDPRFEEVSAYYWMDRAQRYLQAQGHHLREEPIGVAVHYAAGTNAGYMIGRNMIYFMDGLVDTAEDADVVRHEYGHAVLDAACGPRLYDYYGAMFHEGFADFFSYMIAQDAEAEVGPDRYPEFMGEWIGRGRNSQPSYLRTFHKPVFSYPFLTYRPHTDGTLWSSLFYELSLSLGLENTSDLLLETLYRLDSAEPAEVSARLLEVETLLFAGTHRAQLEKSLKDRGLYQPETTMNITELGMGAQSFPVDGKLRYFRFQAPAGGGDLHIQIKSSTGGFVGAFMGKAFLPDAYTYDIYHPSYDTNNVSWVLRADGLSHPRLEPGSWYMIGVMANWGRSYEISLETVTADPIPSWLDGAPLQFELRPFESRTFHLGELAGVTEIALQSSAELVYTTISQSLPKTTQHPADGTSQGSYVSSTTYWGQNLRGMDPLEDKFLTVFNPFYEPQSLTFSWETTTTSFIQTLALNTPQTRVLGKSYQNVWQLDLTEDADQLNFITEAQHAFFVLPIQPGQFIFPAFSTLQNGKHTVSANPNLPFVSTLESLSEVGAGTYYVVVEGAEGETVELQANNQVTSVSEWPASGVDQTLQPGEMLKFQFSLPEGAEQFWVEALNLVENQRLLIHAMPREGASDRLAWYDELNAQRPFFKVDKGLAPLATAFPDFVPGGSYEIWFSNPTETPQPLRALLSFEGATPIETLTDGQTVRLPGSGSENLYLGRAYAKPFWVVPPPGTQRVSLCVENPGSEIASAYLRAQDGRLHATPLVEAEFSETQLRDVPEEPFVLYLVKSAESTDLEFQVSLSFLPDGPHRAKLTPEQPSTVQKSVSWRMESVELVAPAGTRQVDVAWLPDKDLDSYMYLLADRGLQQPGFDAPTSRIVTSDVREDFLLKGDSAYGEMEPGSWTLSTYLGNGYPNLEDASFPFEWAVRYRDLHAAWRSEAPRTVGGKTMGPMLVRIQNPNATAARVTLNTQAGQFVDTVAPGGFTGADLLPGSSVSFSADMPLVVMQAQWGEGWATSAAAPAFATDELLLPHVSPVASAWSSHLDIHKVGGGQPDLTDYYGQTVPMPLTADESLQNGAAVATWQKLRTKIATDTKFRETTMSATQYWKNANQVVAEIPPTHASRTLFVPHIPNNPAWWSGFTLSNTSRYPTTVSIRAFGPEGPRGAMTTFVIEGGSSKVGVLADFLPAEMGSHQGAWLRIDATEPLLGMEFMGGIHTGDTAGFLLPNRASSRLVLPGNVTVGSMGVAFANTVDLAGEATLSVRDADGAVLKQLSWTMAPFQRILVTEAELAIPAGYGYTIQIDAPTLELVGLQLNVSASGQLAATSAQPVK